MAHHSNNLLDALFVLPAVFYNLKHSYRPAFLILASMGRFFDARNLLCLSIIVRENKLFYWHPDNGIGQAANRFFGLIQGGVFSSYFK